MRSAAERGAPRGSGGDDAPRAYSRAGAEEPPHAGMDAGSGGSGGTPPVTLSDGRRPAAR
jgi:hypothetical protein